MPRGPRLRVREALDHGREVLARAGLRTPDLEAELLLRHVTGWDQAQTIIRSEELLSPTAQDGYAAALLRRERREPLQHITGTQAFWKSSFVVTRDVLIPRPETEILVERSLALLAGVGNPVVIDAGTGSGCIAISLALERPDATVHATEVSRAALEVAKENSRRLGAVVQWHETDLLGGAARWAPRADLVVSNPPYVAPGERADLMPEVGDYEPAVALFPPGDTLHFYRRLVTDATSCLAPGGALAVEIGVGMAAAVNDLFATAGYEGVEVVPDPQQIPRVVSGRKKRPIA